MTDNFESNNKELYLLLGDFNIDSIRLSQKFCEPFKNQSDYAMSNIIEYYISKGILDLDYEITKDWLTNPNRYSILMSILNSGKLRVDDIYYKINKYHPVTYGEFETNETFKTTSSKEITLTDLSDQKSEQNLDYIFILNDKKMFGNNKEHGCVVQRQQSEDITIESIAKKGFYVQNKKYTQLSDHLGIEIVLKVD